MEMISYVDKCFSATWLNSFCVFLFLCLVGYSVTTFCSQNFWQNNIFHSVPSGNLFLLLLIQ